MKRIIVIGASGSGKTTLAAEISRRLGYPHTDLDDLYWLPGWRARDTSVFKALALERAQSPTFVISGNYFSTLSDDLWPKADTFVWLDYSLTRMLWQILRRSWRRVRDKTEIFNGNTEEWRKLFSKDSIVLWLLMRFSVYRKRYKKIYAEAGLYPHRTYVRLTSPRDTRRWLETLSKAIP